MILGILVGFFIGVLLMTIMSYYHMKWHYNINLFNERRYEDNKKLRKLIKMELKK